MNSEVVKLNSETQEQRDRVVLNYDWDAKTNRITSPGKFEGEPIFAPYYWNAGLDGFADDDDGTVYTFRFNRHSQDFAIWPELKAWLGRKRTLHMSEDGSGFVRCW